ncbi:hypothetical protein Tco_1331777, partial [Tanacetum coccineum]
EFEAFYLALLQQWRWHLVTKLDFLRRNEEALENLFSEVLHVSVNNSPDSWKLGIAHDGVFSVHDTHIHVDNAILLSLSPSTSFLHALHGCRGSKVGEQQGSRKIGCIALLWQFYGSM